MGHYSRITDTGHVDYGYVFNPFTGRAHNHQDFNTRTDCPVCGEQVQITLTAEDIAWLQGIKVQP